MQKKEKPVTYDKLAKFIDSCNYGKDCSQCPCKHYASMECIMRMLGAKSETEAFSQLEKLMLEKGLFR